MISQKSIREIMDTARIEEVVGEYVNLKRAGSNLKGLCPFHGEKTPSFSVSPSKNLFKCFGCGIGGDAVRFLMEHEQLSYPEALRQLAAKYNIELEETQTSRESIQERQHQESLYLINQYALEYYQKQLFKTDAGKSIGLSYFKQRGFREETIRKFGLGFAPATKDAFTLQATQDGYKVDLLKKLGLTSQYGRDFFRDRVMFTIYNPTGKPVAFAGRILQKDVKAPKYINSPETDIYVKNKVLYGVNFAKRSIRKEDECILVEGYTDVISLHQAGIENVVASSGTSLTEGQIQLIRRYSPNIKILYDGDAAGIKAALRGLDMVLEQDMNVRVVLLPDGEDPDSYLQRVGASAFQEYVREQAKDFILFKTQLLLEEAADDPIRKSEMIKAIVDSIARIPDPIKRSLYIKQCAHVVGVEEEILVIEVNKMVTGHIRRKRQQERIQERQRARQAGQKSTKPGSEGPPPSNFSGLSDAPPPEMGEEESGAPPDLVPGRPSSSSAVSGDEFMERDIIRLLITFGDQVFDPEEDDKQSVADYILFNIQDVLEEFDNPLFGQVAKECHQRVSSKESIDQHYFLNHQEQSIRQLAIDILHPPYDFSPNWAEKWDITLQTQKDPDKNFTKDSIKTIQLFKMRKIIRLSERNQQKLKEMDASSTEEIMRLLMVQQKLNSIRNELAKQFGHIVTLK
ncbi:MAG: DNA primase [Bacteroidota bacterium]